MSETPTVEQTAAAQQPPPPPFQAPYADPSVPPRRPRPRWRERTLSGTAVALIAAGTLIIGLLAGGIIGAAIAHHNARDSRPGFGRFPGGGGGPGGGFGNQQRGGFGPSQQQGQSQGQQQGQSQGQSGAPTGPTPAQPKASASPSA